MLQVARLAPRVLGSEASAKIAEFLTEQFDPASGGVVDRGGSPDLYYTVFGLEGLVALESPAPMATRTHAFLSGFGDGAELDAVHRCCLARCWADRVTAGLDETIPAPVRAGLAANIHSLRANDGGFAERSGEELGTVYHSFLCHGALEDLGVACPETDRLLAAVLARRTQDGAFGRDPAHRTGSTTVTAAAVTLLRQLNGGEPLAELEPVADWLRDRQQTSGGFLAAPQAPLPDLLSTATALHALTVLSGEPGVDGDACLDFVDTLWTGRGFCGHWADDEVDAEYTFYGLLSLGHLS